MIDIIRQSIADWRDQVIFGEEYSAKKYGGGVRYFDELTLAQIDELIELEVLDMEENQNDAPTVGEMVEFLRDRKTDGWYAHGYCVSPERSDFRISFEGIGKKSSPSTEDIIDFSMLFRWADEFYIGEEGVRCWYD